jgi:hypothetical protein
MPWPATVSRAREVGLRAFFFLLAAIGFFFMQLGLVPMREAAAFGAGVCLITLVLESIAGMLMETTKRFWGRISAPRGGWLERLCPKLLAFGLLVLFSPLVALHPLHTVPKRDPTASGLAF